MTTSQYQMGIEVYNSVGGTAFFQRLQEEWRIAGAQVFPRQAISDAAYRARRGLIGRLSLRFRMYPAYAWTCWWNSRKLPANLAIRVVTTNPFFAPALVARATGGRGATINLLYDLYPEALILTGKISPGSWTASRCAAVTRFAMRECAATVFLGERLREYAESTYGPARRAVVIPAGADGLPFRSSPPRRLADGTHPQILYSGQMGRMHDFETVAGAWENPGTPGVSWVFHASGSCYDRLRRAVGSRDGVSWETALPDADWQQAMKRAHVGLVTIAPGAERVVMPSKAYSALVAGQAILAVCPQSSDLADLVLRHGCGWVVEPGDVAGFRQAVSTIAQDPDELWAKRQRSFAAGHLHYDMGSVAAAWTRLFAELTGRDQAGEMKGGGLSTAAPLTGLASATGKVP